MRSEIVRADLVVVGAGTAGLPCAIEAARGGARVLLLDKAADIGGTLHVSGGHLSAAGTARQAARDIADHPDQHYADVLRISRGTARADLVRLAVDLAPTTVDWLDAHGFNFHPSAPRIVHGHEPYGVPRTYHGTDDARSILSVLRRLLQPHLDSGAVTLWLSAPVRRLRTRDGAITGVEVSRAGADVAVEAPAVVLATGGYAADPVRFAALEGRPLFTAAAPTSTGDGLDLVEQVGGAISGSTAFLPTFGGLPEDGDEQRIAWGDRPLLVATERSPVEIYVDRHGRRFVAEDEPSIDEKERALLALDDLTFWVVLDDPGLEAARGVVVGWSAGDVRAMANRRTGIHRDDSIEDLARAAGVDPEGLVATVGEYNVAVAAGHDPGFGRRALPAPLEHPPFYALRNHGTTLITFGGVDVDEQLRVRRSDGTPIPGLYAAGEVLGAAATSGNAFCGGMLITPALSFGRLLGRRLASTGTTTAR